MKIRMKTLAILLISSASCIAQPTNTNALAAVAATNAPKTMLVTNWIAAPSNYRTIDGLVYEVNSSPKWKTVTLPAFGYYNTHGMGRVGKGPVMLTASFPGNPPSTLSVINYPYNGRDFMQANAASIRPIRNLTLRLFPLLSGTNYAKTGDRITGLFAKYDYGLQYTNLVPIVKRVPIKPTK